MELMKQWEKMTNVLSTTLSPPRTPQKPPSRPQSPLMSPKNLAQDMTPSKKTLIELTEHREQEDDY